MSQKMWGYPGVGFQDALEAEVRGWDRVGIGELASAGITLSPNEPVFTENKNWLEPEVAPLSLQWWLPENRWGWLSCDGMQAGGDNWQMYFQTSGYSDEMDTKLVEEEWVQARLPKNWDGEVEGWQGNPEQGIGVLVGKFYGRKGAGYWITPCERSQVPEWPKLEKGKTHSINEAQTMQLGGVLQRPGQLGPGRTRLAMAWVDPRGEFLGWENVDSMSEVYGKKESQARVFTEMQGFEVFEKELRVQSWGRAL